MFASCKANVLALGVVHLYLHGGLYVPLYDVHCVSVFNLSVSLIGMATKDGWKFRFYEEFCDIYISIGVNCVHVIVSNLKRQYCPLKGIE